MKNVILGTCFLAVILFVTGCSSPMGGNDGASDKPIPVFDPDTQTFAPQNVSTLIIHGDEILDSVVDNYPGINEYYGDRDTFRNLVNADLMPGIPPAIGAENSEENDVDPTKSFSDYYTICYPDLFTVVEADKDDGANTSSVPPWLKNAKEFVAVNKKALKEFREGYQAVVNGAPLVRDWFNEHAKILMPLVNDIGEALDSVFGKDGCSGIYQATQSLFPAIENALGVIGSAIGIITSFINLFSPGSQGPSPYELLSDQIAEFERHVTTEFAGLDLDLTQFFTQSFDAGISGMTTSLAILKDYADIGDTADMAPIISAVSSTYSPLLSQYYHAACTTFFNYVKYLKTLPDTDEKKKVVASDYHLKVTIDYTYTGGSQNEKYPVIDSSDEVVLINPAKYASEHNLQFMNMNSLLCLDSYINEFMSFGPYMSCASGNPMATEIWNYNQAKFILDSIVTPLHTTIDELASAMNDSLQNAYSELDTHAAPALTNIGKVVWLDPHQGPAAHLVKTYTPPYRPLYYVYHYYPLVNAYYRGHSLIGFGNLTTYDGPEVGWSYGYSTGPMRFQDGQSFKIDFVAVDPTSWTSIGTPSGTTMGYSKYYKSYSATIGKANVEYFADTSHKVRTDNAFTTKDFNSTENLNTEEIKQMIKAFYFAKATQVMEEAAYLGAMEVKLRAYLYEKDNN
ncbi:MAG: hypothetical protein JW881_14475 [Spirochaetales bacterium]|nr:hypothetical protein [Spirochaetales bacterium]